MSPARHTAPELDSLIEDITVDCHDEDEQLTAFEAAFDEDGSFPCPSTVIGEEVEVLHVGQADGRRELIAICQRNGRRYETALIDVEIGSDAEPATARLIAAYRRWAGA